MTRSSPAFAHGHYRTAFAVGNQLRGSPVAPSWEGVAPWGVFFHISAGIVRSRPVETLPARPRERPQTLGRRDVSGGARPLVPHHPSRRHACWPSSALSKERQPRLRRQGLKSPGYRLLSLRDCNSFGSGLRRRVSHLLRQDNELIGLIRRPAIVGQPGIDGDDLPAGGVPGALDDLAADDAGLRVGTVRREWLAGKHRDLVEEGPFLPPGVRKGTFHPSGKPVVDVPHDADDQIWHGSSLSAAPGYLSVAPSGLFEVW